MKNILLGLILASSLAMSGDLAKCSQAVDMKLKYKEQGRVAYMEFMKNDYEKNKKKSDNLWLIGIVSLELQNSWANVASMECLGVLTGKGYDFVSQKVNIEGQLKNNK